MDVYSLSRCRLSPVANPQDTGSAARAVSPAEYAVRTHLDAAAFEPKELAGILEIGRSAASLIISGKRGITIRHLDKLATALHLWSGDDGPQMASRSAEGGS